MGCGGYECRFTSSQSHYLHLLGKDERNAQFWNLCIQIDVLESLPPSIPLILPSTTLSETRHRSLPLYNRLQQLIADEERKVWVFWNEVRRGTATRVERYKVGREGRIDEEGDEGMSDDDEEAGGKTERESVNDRNDRGMYPLPTLHSMPFIISCTYSNPPHPPILPLPPNIPPPTPLNFLPPDPHPPHRRSR